MTESGQWRGVAVPVEDHLAVIRQGVEHLYLLNPSASVAWQAWRAAGTTDAMARALQDAYGIDAAQARDDVRALLGQWGEKQLVGALPGESRAEVAGGEAVPQETSSTANIVTYRVGRAAIGMDYRDPGLQALLHPVLSHLEVAEAPGRAIASSFQLGKKNGRYAMWRAGQVLCHSEQPQELALEALRQVFTDIGSAQNAELVLHAAAFGRDGRCILMPGAGGSGKSTLVAAMALEGFDYLGDDMIAIEAGSHRLLPIPASLNLKPASWPVLEARYGALPKGHELRSPEYRVRFLPPTSIACAYSLDPHTVAAVVFPQFVSRSGAVLQTLNALQVIRGLEDSTAAILPDGNLGYAQGLFEWLASLEARQLEFGRLDEAVSVLSGLMD